MVRGRLPRLSGDLRRKENMHHLKFLVDMAEPEGIPRAELVPLYAFDVGVTVKKANEHLDLAIEVGQLIEDDMRIYSGSNLKSPSHIHKKRTDEQGRR